LDTNLIAARATLYATLSSLYLNNGVRKDFDSLVTVLEMVAAEPFIDDAKEVAEAMLATLKSDKEGVLYEFEVLFNLPFGDFINSSASYYYDEREFGEQTILAKEIMNEAGYIKADFVSLGEDDFGLLCAVSSRLLRDNHKALQQRLFSELLLPTVKGFIDAQLNSQRAEFYKEAAKLFALFVAFEKAYFEF